MLYSFGEQNRQFEVKGLSQSADKSNLAILRQNGKLEYWKYISAEESENKQVAFEKSLEFSTELSDIVDLVPIYDSSLSANHLLTFTSSGSILVTKNNPELDIEDIIATSSTLKGPLSAAASAANGAIIVGGKENEIQLYDIMAEKSYWEARNVPHDKLKLRVPVWVTALDFLSPLTGHSFSTDDNSVPVASSKFIAGTAYKHVRLYDTKADRRPVKSIDIEGDFRVNVVKSSIDGNGCYVGDVAGNLYYYDLRTYRRVNILKGFTGSIRSLAIAESSSSKKSSSVIAGVGLDRSMRVYDINNGNKLLTKIYLKNRLNRCLALSNIRLDAPANEDEGKKSKKSSFFSTRDDEDDDYDEDNEEDDEEDDEEEEDREYDEDELEEDNDVLEDIEISEGEKDDEEDDDDEDEESEEEEAAPKKRQVKKRRFN